ncbi:V-set and immunoglobulin domain-containing protein 1-like [Saccoglossus kowalevskii]
MLTVFHNCWWSGRHALCIIVLILYVSPITYGLSVTTKSLHEGLDGGSVILKCQYTAPPDGGIQYVITWDFTPEWGSETETILVKEGTGSETSYGQFSGRASISGSQGDLSITRLEVEDTGTFTCDVDYYVVKDEGSATTQLKVYSKFTVELTLDAR